MKVTTKRKTKGIADQIDKHVGKRLRVRRSLLGISQEKLAEAVGVTFQQVQKYEQGTNRISASRLLGFSRVLQVPVDYFYENLEEKKKSYRLLGVSDSKQTPLRPEGKSGLKYDDIVNKKETYDLVQTYYALDAKERKNVLQLIKAMTKK